MVIGPPDVGEVVEPAAELLGDVADVRGEVGRASVGPVDDPVLVVAEGRGAEPHGAALFVDVAVLAQPLDRPLDPALLVQAALAGPYVEVDTEPFETRFDHRPDPGSGPTPQDARPVGIGGRRRCPDIVRHGRGQVGDVGPLVSVLGDWLALADGQDRGTEVVDLPARVIEVVLAGDLLPADLEDPAEQVADERPARVTDRQRAGRVGGHELHVDPPWTDRGDPAPGRGLLVDAVDDRGERVAPEAQVEEARRRHLDGLDRRRRASRTRVPDQLGGKDGRDRQRRHPVGARQLHGEVRGEVAMIGVGRVLHVDRRTRGVAREGRQVGGLDGDRPGTLDGVADLGAKRVGDHEYRPRRGGCSGRSRLGVQSYRDHPSRAYWVGPGPFRCGHAPESTTPWKVGGGLVQ